MKLNQVREGLGQITDLETVLREHGWTINKFAQQWESTDFAQITANQNNYDVGDATVARLSSDAARNITGLVTGPQNAGLITIVNVGAQNIVLKHQDANSTAANRIIGTGGADVTLGANATAQLLYDSVTLRWRVL